MQETPYKKAKMTNWFQPSMLLNVALKSLISGTFGNYADRRELQAALSSKEEDSDPEMLRKRLVNNKKEIWIDFLCDTGDGFDSTYSVAKKVAQSKLSLSVKDDLKEFETKRGEILILGGDEVYPYPTLETYTNKFRVPFEAAADKAETVIEENRPLLFAIPGNHDWYDGLGNFMKLFCQQRRIGIWRTVQKRSYFAIPLPNNYWIWATDIQLNSNIDQPQLDYFTQIAKSQMQQGDKIILVTAEPAWIYQQVRKNDQSYDRLQFFISRQIKDSYQVIGKTFKLAANLTGDLHHYARYSRTENGRQYITSGGGGAFLHLTHNLPDVLESITENTKEEMLIQRGVFPSKKQSRRLLLGNLLFPVKNWAFTSLSWLVYLYLFWLLQSHHAAVEGGFFLTEFTNIPALGFLEAIGKYIVGAPSLALSIGTLFAGFWLFIDRKVRRRGTYLVGFTHACMQTLLLFATMYVLAQTTVIDYWGDWLGDGLIVLIFSLAGGTAAALLMGVYLYLSSRFLGMHDDESSSSLAHPHFKNFIRLHVHDKGTTIYPIGIKKVQQNWKVSGNAPNITVTGDDFETLLIEPPIEVLDVML